MEINILMEYTSTIESQKPYGYILEMKLSINKDGKGYTDINREESN